MNINIKGWLPGAEVGLVILTMILQKSLGWKQLIPAVLCTAVAGSCYHQGCGTQKRVPNGLLKGTFTQKKQPLFLTHS